MQDGVAAYSSDVGAGWGGEAFGKELAAMTIEGNWITGAMKNDFPDVDYTVVRAARRARRQGTLQFTNCWGMAADSDNVDGARLAGRVPDHAGAAAGVRRGVRRDAVRRGGGRSSGSEQYPELRAVHRRRRLRPEPARPRRARPTSSPTSTPSSQTLKDADPQQILDGVQENLEAVLSN